MRIEDHRSGCVAHMAVLAGKFWFLGKSRSNPSCMGECGLWVLSGTAECGVKGAIEHLEVVRVG